MLSISLISPAYVAIKARYSKFGFMLLAGLRLWVSAITKYSKSKKEWFLKIALTSELSSLIVFFLKSDFTLSKHL